MNTDWLVLIIHSRAMVSNKYSHIKTIWENLPTKTFKLKRKKNIILCNFIWMFIDDLKHINMVSIQLKKQRWNIRRFKQPIRVTIRPDIFVEFRCTLLVRIVPMTVTLNNGTYIHGVTVQHSKIYIFHFNR